MSGEPASAESRAAAVTGEEPPEPDVTGSGRRRRAARSTDPRAEPCPGAPTAVAGLHLPALDGLRAVAVAGVLAYHLRLGWASGGYLGVDLFFVLSGFLITSLLLEEQITTGTIRLAAFWARRARRLLPALFLLLAAIGVYVVVLGRLGPQGSVAHIDLSGLRGDSLATLFYVANWHSIFAHQSYFGEFAAPSLLRHTWSLAIEEQFYLAWPPILILLLACWRRRRRWPGLGWRPLLGAVVVGAGLGSAALMAVLYHPGTDPTRVYFGTDTRIFDMLAGVVVAVAVAGRRQPGRRARAVLHAVSLPAAAVLALFWIFSGTASGLPRSGMFDGGMLLCAGLGAVVVADVRQIHRGPLAAVLSQRPLRWVGTISYGIYLWHWPIFVAMTSARTGLTGAGLDLARVGTSLVAATASYYLVERPLRRWNMAGWPRFALAPMAAAVTAAVVVAATFPAVAVPAPAAAGTSMLASGQRVPGAGGYQGQAVIDLPRFGPGHPLRVTVMGDSVARVAEPAIAAALGATGEVSVTNGAIDGFGLNVDPTWRAGIPRLVVDDRTQLVLATWSWDDSCTPSTAARASHYATLACALQHPRRYRAMLGQAVRLMLTKGGASGVVFLQFPPSGPPTDAAA
ncbi:MAG: acyltransferase family protein, partial [Acidimicrobiales bacterium]